MDIANEQRRHPRLSFQGTVFLELPSPGGGRESQILLCETVNISRGGLCLGIDREIPVGTILPAGVELYDEEGLLHLTGAVTWCEPHPEQAGTWRTGFELLSARDSDIEPWRAVLGAMETEA